MAALPARCCGTSIRLPDDTAERLKTLARARKLSVNKLIE